MRWNVATAHFVIITIIIKSNHVNNKIEPECSAQWCIHVYGVSVCNVCR